MTNDSIYQIVLLGKIAAEYDAEITREKLAIIFEIDLKKIPKLLKKPTIIRKNLTREVALKYKVGLEKIGVPCDIIPPIETDNDPKMDDESEMYSLSDEEKKTLILDSDKLRVIDIKIPFNSLMVFIFKWTLASIPALILLGIIGYFIQQMIGGMSSNFV